MKPPLLRRSSLRLFTVMALAMYNAVLGFQVLRDHQTIVETATLRAGNIAHVLAGQIANYLTFVDATLETIDFLAAILPPLAEDDTSVATVQSLMAAKADRLEMIRGFLVADADGTMIMDETGRPTAMLDLSDRDYFKAHREPHAGGVFVGEPAVGRTSGKWFLGVSRRRGTAEGTFNGVIAAIVEPAYLGRTLAAADLGQRGVATLLASSGTIIARSSGHDTMVGRHVGQDEGLQRAGPTLTIEPLSGHDVSAPAGIVASVPVIGFPVNVVVALDSREVLIPWQASLPSYGLAMLLPSAAAIAATMLIRRQQRALEAREASLQDRVTELRESKQLLRASVGQLEASRRKLEDQNAALATLAEERAAAQAKAEASSMAKSLFLASMSHELRTPLNAIIGFAELIRQSPLHSGGDPEHVDFAESIHASGHHLLDLINNILDFSRIQAKEGFLDLEPVSVGAITRSCIGRVQQRATDAGIMVENRIAESLVAMADERALRQVLTNLLSNAIKFTPSGGVVTLDAAEAQDRLRVTVADTGIGIRPEDLARLGQPFEQIHNQLHDKPAGTGLGLALSRRLVELHGGTLALESEVGVGTTVSFSLPLEPAGVVVDEVREAIPVG